MNKQFKALLENELLSEDVRKELAEAVEAYKAQLVEDTRKSLEVEFATKFQNDKSEITNKLIALVNEQVAAEMKELKEDIETYRNLEVTYATKLEEFKQEYADKLSEGFETLVKTQVTEEMKELRQDLLEAKKHNFGQKIFEAFKSEFETFGIGPDVVELQNSIDKLQAELTESKTVVSSMEREKVLNGLLSNLSGTKREIMKTILENVATDKLEARYNEAVPSILAEAEDKTKEEETKTQMVTEGDKTVITSNGKNPELERIRNLIRK
jgi:hypothetical protein